MNNFYHVYQISIQNRIHFVLLYNQDLWGAPLREVGLVFLAVATVLTIISMVQYLRAAYPRMKM